MLASASMDFDKATFNLSVYSYVLSKIMSKPRFLQADHAPAMRNIERDLERLIRQLPTSSEPQAEALFQSLDRSIKALERKDSRFLIDLMTKGKLKTASTLYAQGMSLGVASDLTGIEKQEILDYAGSSMMFDRIVDELGILERMKNARRFLGGA